MIISRDDMAEHIHTGHAQPWTHPHTPDRKVWEAARMWWVVLSDDSVYRPAPPALSAALNTAQDVLSLPEPPPQAEDLTREHGQRVANALTRVREQVAAASPPTSGFGAVIPPQAMTVHLQSGAAKPWPDTFGPDKPLDAVRLWFFVPEGENAYRLAPDVVARELDDVSAQLAEIARHKDEIRANGARSA